MRRLALYRVYWTEAGLNEFTRTWALYPILGFAEQARTAEDPMDQRVRSYHVVMKPGILLVIHYLRFHGPSFRVEVLSRRTGMLGSGIRTQRFPEAARHAFLRGVP